MVHRHFERDRDAFTEFPFIVIIRRCFLLLLALLRRGAIRCIYTYATLAKPSTQCMNRQHCPALVLRDLSWCTL